MPSARMVANARSSAAPSRPTRSSALASIVAPALAAALELLVHREALRRREQRVVDLAQPLERHAGPASWPATPAGTGSGIGATKSSSGLSDA